MCCVTWCEFSLHFEETSNSPQLLTFLGPRRSSNFSSLWFNFDLNSSGCYHRQRDSNPSMDELERGLYRSAGRTRINCATPNVQVGMGFITQCEVRVRSTWTQLNPPGVQVDPARFDSPLLVFGVLIWWRSSRLLLLWSMYRLDVVWLICGASADACWLCDCSAGASEKSTIIQQKWEKSEPNVDWSLVSWMAVSFGSNQNQTKRGKIIINALILWNGVKTHFSFGKTTKTGKRSCKTNQTREKFGKPKAEARCVREWRFDGSFFLSLSFSKRVSSSRTLCWRVPFPFLSPVRSIHPVDWYQTKDESFFHPPLLDLFSVDGYVMDRQSWNW